MMGLLLKPGDTTPELNNGKTRPYLASFVIAKAMSETLIVLKRQEHFLYTIGDKP